MKLRSMILAACLLLACGEATQKLGNPKGDAGGTDAVPSGNDGPRATGGADTGSSTGGTGGLGTGGASSTGGGGSVLEDSGSTGGTAAGGTTGTGGVVGTGGATFGTGGAKPDGGVETGAGGTTIDAPSGGTGGGAGGAIADASMDRTTGDTGVIVPDTGVDQSATGGVPGTGGSGQGGTGGAALDGSAEDGADDGGGTDGGGNVDDPFDPASCQGPGMTQAEGIALFPPGTNATPVLGSFAVYARRRLCSTLTGCGAWEPSPTDHLPTYGSEDFPVTFACPSADCTNQTNGFCKGGDVRLRSSGSLVWFALESPNTFGYPGYDARCSWSSGTIQNCRLNQYFNAGFSVFAVKLGNTFEYSGGGIDLQATVTNSCARVTMLGKRALGDPSQYMDLQAVLLGRF